MRRSLAGLALSMALVVAACGDDDAVGDDPSGGDGPLTGRVTVFAAASLTDAFTAIAEGFEARHGEVTVALNFAGSSSLREQVLAGAPADVFASADAADMDALVSEGLVDEPRDFATNHLAIAVPAGNPGGVDGLDDFADDDLLIGLCAERVPCGSLARRALDRAGVDPAPDTDEPDVRALLTKIEAGELDAGLVYVTDVIAAGPEVLGIELPPEHDVVAAYPIAVVDGSQRHDAAVAFAAYVLAPEGQEVLAELGFGGP